MRNLYGFLNGIINNFCIFIEIYITVNQKIIVHEEFEKNFKTKKFHKN